MRKKTSINLLALLAVLILGAGMVFVAYKRIAIDTDLARSLPTGDPVIADGIHIFEKNPIKDQIAIDIGGSKENEETLLAAADLVEAELKKSGLFAQVGNKPMHRALADLADHVIQHLPVLFTAGELEHQVAPLLTEERIGQALVQARDELYRMDGIGQAKALAADPLGLRNIVLSRLASLNPAPGASILHGRILSADRRHLLVLATPKGSGTDTAVARNLSRFFGDLEQKVDRQFGNRIVLTPTGAYRAALDNETIVKKDVHRAILWATVGIGILLLMAFSRPLVGILALLPALAGTVMAFFVFSWLRDSISIMVLGFGGAIISITVDHGIAYMLFLDSDAGSGRHGASREIRAVGLLAVLTSVGAFGALAFSGFAVFEQLGLFTAMGIGFAFLFVHTVFPRILKTEYMEAPSPRKRFSRLVDLLASGGKAALILSLLAAVALGFFAKPRFNTDLKTMNSVSPETRTADETMAAVWGDIFSSVYLMTEAGDLDDLQARNDRLLEQLDTEVYAGGIEKPVTPSLFFPGRGRCAENGAAWRRFWSPQRIQAVSAAIVEQGAALGFTHGAFAPFLGAIAADPPAKTEIPAAIMPLLSISRDDADGSFRQMTRITPRGHFNGQRFFARISPLSSVFDPTLFSQRMGRLLFETFSKMLLIIGASLIVLLALFFADLGLLLTSLLPLVFAFVCTLGTLGLMGRALDIPALMLAVVILGMGVDYTLFLVRGYQRYQHFDHPHFTVVRTAVFMAAASTLVGFAVLLTADHGLLKSAGWIGFLGIGYCLAGALLLLPPLLKRRFEGHRLHAGGIEARYSNMEPYPRMFARYKLRLDPLFDELALLLPPDAAFANIMDVGCGYGVPACWMAERYPTATIFGFDPRQERVRVASLALGDRGRIRNGSAPDLPPMDVLVDLATMLDMSHYLQDWELEKTLERIHDRLLPGGRLIVRSVLPRSARPHWTWYLEHFRIKRKGLAVCYRDSGELAAILQRCGFEVMGNRPSGKREDMVWHVAKIR